MREQIAEAHRKLLARVSTEEFEETRKELKLLINKNSEMFKN